MSRTPNAATKPKRQYSRAFPVAAGDRSRAFTIRNIPADLLDAVQARAKRERVSLRALILQGLTDYLVSPERDDVAS